MEREANEHANGALKQLRILAAAILACTNTFIKDARGDARNLASIVFLVPIVWDLLTIMIWTARVAILNALRQLGGASQTCF
jgi:hypothetical protein